MIRSQLCAGIGLMLTALAAAPSAAQGPEGAEILAADRSGDVIYRMVDTDLDGVITEPGEVNVFFSAANAAGTIGPQNFTCMAVGADRRVLVGDQGNQLVYLLMDLNDDGDAQDADESIVFADQSNASGHSLAFPTGATFDRAGVAYIMNAGNASGPDACYRLFDLTADGDAQDAGEIEVYVNFGGDNGPYSPQEILTDASLPDCDLYFRNSSANLQGIFIFQGSARSADRGGPTLFDFWTAGAMVTPSAGFALERDRFRTNFTPGPPLQPYSILSMYTLQIVSGGVDQLVRCTQRTLDGDANDADESFIVYENAAAGFTAIDVASFPNGTVLVSDSSADQIIRLDDTDADGFFTSAGEVTPYFANTGPTLADLRQISIYRIPCPVDLDGNGAVGSADLAIILGAWGTTGPGDFNGNGIVGSADLAILLGAWGPCPIAV